jgi:hypothetical protein
MIVFAS